ncbi:hypothetical protein BIY21_06440 [Vibrio ponticus]|uniref:Glycosyltransferase family 1 protein n=1 Tax=Vibrio ponticus TaxID=265668 RepID=A0ABX3FN22_9VIBR|nr:hypothetical protein [Vibrio ponticus]OLQ95337.1 hypothetical protein BIY21_06440 [Vibrio ponticus]
MRDLIVFTSYKQSKPNNSVEIVQCLDNFKRVIWVNLDYTQRSGKHVFPKHQCPALLHAGRGENIYLNIADVPVTDTQNKRERAKQIILDALMPILYAHQISRPVLWTSERIVADLLDQFDRTSLVYLCDKEETFQSVQHAHIAFLQEQLLVNCSDVVFAANENLCAQFPAKKTFLLQQGVDLKLFCTPAPKAVDLPNNGKPTAGFYADLDTHIDFRLLFLTALSRPDWNFAVLGANKLPHYPLPRLNNVYYLGPKQHRLLPSYSQHWQASILPLASTGCYSAAAQQTLLEYLAVGAPIITTDRYNIGRFSKYVNLVQSAHEMSEALQAAVYEPKRSADLVFSDSWQVRSRFVDSVLQVIPR